MLWPRTSTLHDLNGLQMKATFDIILGAISHILWVVDMQETLMKSGHEIRA